MRPGLFEAITGYFADGQPIGNVSLQNQRIQSILDHVTRLLNSRRGMIAHLPDYGLPDIQEVYNNMPKSVDFLAREIKATVEKYEPRLRKIDVVEQKTDDAEFRLTFMIKCDIIGGEKVKFYTMFSTAGSARVNSQIDTSS